jgi:hypothetical protein
VTVDGLLGTVAILLEALALYVSIVGDAKWVVVILWIVVLCLWGRIALREIA